MLTKITGAIAFAALAGTSALALTTTPLAKVDDVVSAGWADSSLADRIGLRGWSDSRTGDDFAGMRKAAEGKAIDQRLLREAEVLVKSADDPKVTEAFIAAHERSQNGDPRALEAFVKEYRDGAKVGGDDRGSEKLLREAKLVLEKLDDPDARKAFEVARERLANGDPRALAEFVRDFRDAGDGDSRKLREEKLMHEAMIVLENVKDPEADKAFEFARDSAKGGDYAGLWTFIRNYGRGSSFPGKSPFPAGPAGPGDGGSVGAVPEPATWAMMVAGFGLVGGAVRRRASTAVAA